MQLFVTGTDTGVGKTYFSSWLVRQWRAQGLPAAGIKPISCGGLEDAEALQTAGGNELTLEEINVMRFDSPVSPYAASLLDDIPFDWNAVTSSIAAARARFPHLVVEGIGGWLVPLEGEKTVREWAIDMQLPVLIVARAGLGTINHTLLTIESVKASGLPILGIVMNAGVGGHRQDQSRSTNPGTLGKLTDFPIFVFNRENEAAGALPKWLAAT